MQISYRFAALCREAKKARCSRRKACVRSGESARIAHLPTTAEAETAAILGSGPLAA